MSRENRNIKKMADAVMSGKLTFDEAAGQVPQKRTRRKPKPEPKPRSDGLDTPSTDALRRRLPGSFESGKR